MSAPLGSTLRIAIVGAGMGGLATALSLAKQGFQHIAIYETASDLGFVGAGIQIAPNLSRILRALGYGVWERVKKDAVEMKAVSIRVGATDEELANVSLMDIAQRFGQPHCVAHRSSLANALYEGCKAAAPHISVYFQTTVLGVDFDGNRIQVKERDGGAGRWIDFDVLLGADGIKSVVRRCMLERTGAEGDVTDTGQASYRIMLRRDQLVHDPELLAFVESDSTYRWIGAHRHIIAYPISSNTILNISTAQPDTNFAAEPTLTWTTRASKFAMLGVYADFCDRVQRLLRLVPEGEVCEWKLRVHSPLESWVEGSVALVGDACHPTLPHLNQGAAQAIEDGAVLGVVLSKIEDRNEVNAALRVYEHLRKPRTTRLVEAAAASGRELQLSDPEAQAKRNEVFRRLRDVDSGRGGDSNNSKSDAERRRNPDQAYDRSVQDEAFGFDCVEDAERRWGML